jgi:hypothetical protein
LAGAARPSVRTQDADMIVLGSRGAGGFTRLPVGSVAGQVAQHAHCPVLIVPLRTVAERSGISPCRGKTAFLVAMMAWSTGSAGL